MKITFNLTGVQAEKAYKEIDELSSNQFVRVVKREVSNIGADGSYALSEERSGVMSLINGGSNVLTLKGHALTYQGRRHAVWQAETIVSTLLIAGVLLLDEKGGLTPNKNQPFFDYDSQRADTKWWDYGLAPQLVGLERRRAAAEGLI